MLAIEAARAAGFRDSLYFFRRNPLIHKLTCSQTEKEALISEGKLQSNLRTRQVTMVTAKSLFKVFGAKVIRNGKFVTDDYYEKISLDQGHMPGEYAQVSMYDPELDYGSLAAVNKLVPEKGKLTTGKALFGAILPTQEKTGTQFGLAGLPPYGVVCNPSARNRVPANVYLTATNWQHEYAKNLSEFNSAIYQWRGDNMTVLDLGVPLEEEVATKTKTLVVPAETVPEGEVALEVFEGKNNEMDTEPKVEVGTPLVETPNVETPSIDTPNFDTPSIDTPNVETPDEVNMDIDENASTLDIPTREVSQAPSASVELLPVVAPKKRKRPPPTKGLFDTQTNIPHVRYATQPETAQLVHVSDTPQLEGIPPEVAKVAGRYGICTITYDTSRWINNEERWYSESLKSRAFRPPGKWQFREDTEKQHLTTTI